MQENYKGSIKSKIPLNSIEETYSESSNRSNEEGDETDNKKQKTYEKARDSQSTVQFVKSDTRSNSLFKNEMRQSTKIIRPSFDAIIANPKNSFNTQNTINSGGKQKIDEILESPLLKRKKSIGDQTKSITPFGDKIENKKQNVKSRQQKMFHEIQTNIMNSNLNINDPEKFYNDWFIEIHNKKEMKSRKILQSEISKLSKKLDRIEEMLKNKLN